MPATLYLYADRVRIVASRYEVNRPRKFVAHEGSTLAVHRAAMVAAVSGKRGKRYLKRQQLRISTPTNWGLLKQPDN